MSFDVLEADTFGDISTQSGKHIYFFYAYLLEYLDSERYNGKLAVVHHQQSLYATSPSIQYVSPDNSIHSPLQSGVDHRAQRVVCLNCYRQDSDNNPRQLSRLSKAVGEFVDGDSKRWLSKHGRLPNVDLEIFILTLVELIATEPAAFTSTPTVCR
ncbi:hypothetical protein BDN70DRAFT_924023 [Pholiota conissans]|uniref:Uncharacterized protein n=1 Tax=Pholiota conissans TaxID=109636 RepID=A0A9P6CQ45_9AGAR|nr:hypothetical protein BDN70DRAFT_924023 [Pholiota conissans]